VIQRGEVIEAFSGRDTNTYYYQNNL